MLASKTASPDVSVVMPILNEARHITQAVTALQRQVFDGSMEFLLVDGGSTDGTVDVLREVAARDARFRVLHNPGRRTPHALNVGLREARGRYVVRMDAHTFYEPDYAARGVERLERGGVTWVSGPALPRATNEGSRRTAVALGTWLGVGAATFRKETADEVEVDTAFAGVMHRTTLEDMGGWDQGWPVNQDAELAARVQAAGGRLVCIPEMAAGYVPRDSLRGLAQQYFYYGQYRAKTSKQHPDSMRPTHLLAPGLALVSVSSLWPTRLARLLRQLLVMYGVAITVTSLRHSHTLSDVVMLPAVFITMHLCWGVGFFVGAVRFGPPLAALASVVRRLLARQGNASG